MEELTEKQKAARILGSIGGKAFVKKYGREQMAELGRRSAAKRWGKKHEQQKS